MIVVNILTLSCDLLNRFHALTKFLSFIRYGTHGMYSLTVRIPFNKNQNQNINLQQVFNSDPPQHVKDQINKGDVYIGHRVVAATMQSHVLLTT